MSTFIKPPLPPLDDVVDLDGLMQARDAELLRAVADWLSDKDDCIAPGQLAMAADELRKAAEQ